MKLKSIVFVMSCLLVLGVSANVFAVSDDDVGSIGLHTGVDLATASVVTSDKTDAAGDPAPGGIPQRANLGVTMEAGSHLPAVVIWDIDVDSNAATGGGSIVTGIPTALCPDGLGNPATCKSDALGEGFDFSVILTLRKQTKGSLRNCAGCSGGAAQCATRGASADCGVDGICYELDTSCDTGTDCYAVGDRCEVGCPTISVYPMDVLCENAPAASCARPYLWGEWSVGYGQTAKVINGNVHVPLGYSPIDETEICIEIPWYQIVSEVNIRKDQDPLDPDDLNFSLTGLPDAPSFQVTTMFNQKFNDGDAGDNNQDFFRLKYSGEPAGFYLAITDWMPEATYTVLGEYNSNTPCGHNTEGAYGDQDVDGGDVGDFIDEFGRGGFNKPCPNCKL